ncbi:hypothetical protein ACU4GD_10235 [Cupriavidus basilensis]
MASAKSSKLKALLDWLGVMAAATVFRHQRTHLPTIVAGFGDFARTMAVPMDPDAASDDSNADSARRQPIASIGGVFSPEEEQAVTAPGTGGGSQHGASRSQQSNQDFGREHQRGRRAAAHLRREHRRPPGCRNHGGPADVLVQTRRLLGRAGTLPALGNPG